MIRAKIKKMDALVIESVSCNICGNKILDKGCGREYATISAEWGYDSNKDMTRHEAHICESCYDAKIVPLLTVDHLVSDGYKTRQVTYNLIEPTCSVESYAKHFRRMGD
jgi:hypothetical protein